MPQQPEALRLADLLDGDKPMHCEQAAAELRRLHILQEYDKNRRLAEALTRITTLEAALRLALEALDAVYGKGKKCEAAITAAKQALKENT